MKYQSGTVMVTDNFGMFELMEENRKDAEVRAEKIKKSGPVYPGSDHRNGPESENEEVSDC